MKEGVLMVALGHPIYGKQAAALAASIRRHDKEMPIVVYTDDKALNRLEKFERNLFTEIRPIPEEYYMLHGVEQYIRAKTHVYDLSPFETTLYLDVDMIWGIRKTPRELFDMLAKVDFTMINEGYIDMATGESKLKKGYTFWAPVEKIKAAYAKNKKFSAGKLHQLRSELIWFKKKKKIENFFNLVKQVYNDPKVEVSYFGNAIADEFAFNIASTITGVHPHALNFCPVYWEFRHLNTSWSRKDIYERFFAISIGGNESSKMHAELYDDISKKSYEILGIWGANQYKNKKRYLTERHKF